MTDRYIIVRLNYAGTLGKTHLLDTTIPEPRTGGDRSEIVCDNALWALPPRDYGLPETLGFLDTLDTMPDTSAGFGTAAARWPICHRCYDKAWAELLARTLTNSPALSEPGR